MKKKLCELYPLNAKRKSIVENAFSLTPGFSRVRRTTKTPNRLNGFAAAFLGFTSLKRGANENGMRAKPAHIYFPSTVNTCRPL